MKVKFIPVYQFPPIVDVGADYEADGGQCSSGDGAVEMSWPLPIQAPLEPMPPCMEFYQVRIEYRVQRFALFSTFSKKSTLCIALYLHFLLLHHN